MAVLIDPNKVKVISQNGQITLALQIDLNINLNALNVSPNGNIVQGETGQNLVKKTASKEDDESAALLVPDFTSKEKVKFGK